MSRIDGIGVALMAAGSLFVYAGLTSRTIPAEIQTLIKGGAPTSVAAGLNPFTGGSVTTQTSPAGGTITSQGGQPAGTDAQNQALGKLLAGAYGWGSGSEWTSLNNIVMAESGWSSTIVNPTSGAAGIAQNINGFGPGYERGNARQQIAWLLRYVKQRYVDPVAAWQFHLANGWY